MRTRDWGVIAWRLAILVGFIGAWQWLTGIKAISKTPGLYWIDPFFISRPSLIVERFLHLASGNVRLSIWQMALSTVQSTVWGFPASGRAAVREGFDTVRPPRLWRRRSMRSTTSPWRASGSGSFRFTGLPLSLARIRRIRFS